MKPLICMSQISETPVFEGLLRATNLSRSNFTNSLKSVKCVKCPSVLLHNTETHPDTGIQADKGQSVGSSLQKNKIVQTLSSYLSHWYISKPRNMLNNSQYIYIDINYTPSVYTFVCSNVTDEGSSTMNNSVIETMQHFGFGIVKKAIQRFTST